MWYNASFSVLNIIENAIQPKLRNIGLVCESVKYVSHSSDTAHRARSEQCTDRYSACLTHLPTPGWVYMYLVERVVAPSCGIDQRHLIEDIILIQPFEIISEKKQKWTAEWTNKLIHFPNTHTASFALCFIQPPYYLKVWNNLLFQANHVSYHTRKYLK